MSLANGRLIVFLQRGNEFLQCSNERAKARAMACG